jgi:hypothetical protein
MYAIECHDMVFPKYAKLVFKINQSGNITISASPSLTPGKNPPGYKEGPLPKGTKVFDYTKEILVSIGFTDCLNIIAFANNKRPNITPDKPNTVDIFRNSFEYNKHVTFTYTPDDNDPTKVKMCTIFFNSSSHGVKNEFYLPLSLKSLDEISELCKSYAANVTVIKTICGLENAHYPYNPNSSGYTSKYPAKKTKEEQEKTEELRNKYSNLYKDEEA